jgi:hypothetical protein
MTRRSEDLGGDGPATGLGERIVVLFLVLAAVVLAYVRFRVVPERSGPEAREFDLSNPMLDAKVGDCVEVESTSHPGEVTCFQVREPGVVLRPRQGPARVGNERGLRGALPYLLCRVRYPPAGKDCASEGDAREDVERFNLNAFGMPAAANVEVTAIRPRWVQRGGRFRFTYEVLLMRYGESAGPWVVYLSPDAPVTGTIYRINAAPGGDADWTVFRRADCP